MAYLDIETIIFIAVIYVFLIITVAKLGTYKACGGKKGLAISLIFTPIVGFFYVAKSPKKNLLKITHYKCGSCGLEYTTYHKYCPSCLKDGEKHRLGKKSMRTF